MSVNYVDKRLYPPKPEDVTQDFMKNILRTKFSHWRYEREYRSFVGLKEEENGHYFLEFSSSELVLKEVIVGCESDVTRDDVDDALSGHTPHVEAFKARAAFRSFNVVRNKNDAMWS